LEGSGRGGGDGYLLGLIATKCRLFKNKCRRIWIYVNFTLGLWNERMFVLQEGI